LRRICSAPPQQKSQLQSKLEVATKSLAGSISTPKKRARRHDFEHITGFSPEHVLMNQKEEGPSTIVPEPFQQSIHPVQIGRVWGGPSTSF
jgi:hypothetical protein